MIDLALTSLLATSASLRTAKGPAAMTDALLNDIAMTCECSVGTAPASWRVLM